MDDELPKLRTDPWPWLHRHPQGTLHLSFDAPLTGDDRVDWLRVRDWLAAAYWCEFANAMEAPTLEWLVHVDARFAGSTVQVVLGWNDFPDELELVSSSPAGDSFLEHVAERLRRETPDLGCLSRMDRDQWADWMVSLGAHDYRKPENRGSP